MLFQKLNGIKKKRVTNMRMAQHRHIGHEPITDAQTGFLHHRNGFPLHYKQLRFAVDEEHAGARQGNVGLLFHSDKYLKPGTTWKRQSRHGIYRRLCAARWSWCGNGMIIMR